ncbi:MAG TPA: TIGR00730 family Rossman fold protein, partial [Myxococcota bacterium]
MTRIAVYCGASARVDDKYLAAARAFGTLCAARKIGVVYGGCSTGLMGAVADGCLNAGGEVIGIVPDIIAV